MAPKAKPSDRTPKTSGTPRAQRPYEITFLLGFYDVLWFFIRPLLCKAVSLRVSGFPRPPWQAVEWPMLATHIAKDVWKRPPAEKTQKPGRDIAIAKYPSVQ